MIIVNEFADINATVHHIMEVYGWVGEGMDHAWISMHIMRVSCKSFSDYRSQNIHLKSYNEMIDP